MKTLKSIFLLSLLIAGASCFEAKGQVTIGADIEPLKGVLLDIKSTAGTGGTATTDVGGLGLPRVALTSLTSLAPFLNSTEEGVTNAKADRTGLTVYNITNNSTFKPGIYVWNGTKWTVTGGGARWFYMPAINISVTSQVTDVDFDLYDAYKKQFTRSGNTTFKSNPNYGGAYVPSPESDRIYNANELDYVITYYDTQVFSSVAVDDNGKMKYSTVANPVITPNTYFNVVFIVR
ncbi:MAG: hypothetical protein LBP25_00795 [Tannerellaceae bacterium]|jgi:hypothetical protein|nr:hypothetical protein [Tannerellaceae bacterium]